VGRGLLGGCGVWDLSYSVTATTACDSGLTHADPGNAASGGASEPVAVLGGCLAGRSKSKGRSDGLWARRRCGSPIRRVGCSMCRGESRADGACGCSCTA